VFILPLPKALVSAIIATFDSAMNFPNRPTMSNQNYDVKGMHTDWVRR
jgi:hypothetical protein